MNKLSTNNDLDSRALICAPELLFDQKFVDAELSRFQSEKLDETSFRRETSALLLAQNERGRANIAAAFSKNVWAADPVIASYAYLTDQIVLTSYEVASTILHADTNPEQSESLAVFGVGGYGRADMAPFSDVDLLFLSQQKLSAWAEKVIETMLYILWDTRLKIGHSTRTVEECISLGGQDQTIKTALLESRFLTGDDGLRTEFKQTLRTQLFAGTDRSFVEDKLAERAARHKRQGQRYMVEPNVKEGKGGLRDLQTLYWITKHISGARALNSMVDLGYFTQTEFENFQEAHAFLWTVRCHLHLYNKRATEQLTFDAQVEIAETLGYKNTDGMRAVEHFMQDYFRYATHVGDLTRIFLAELEARHVKAGPTIGQRMLRALPWGKANDGLGPDYRLVHNRLTLADESTFFDDPLNIMRVFEEAMQSGILIHPETMRAIRANLNKIDDSMRADPEAQRIFLSLLLDFGNPERALRRMNELGVLGAFIPEFQRIIALMQFNIYHSYTVDEHTIQCISVLAQLEQGNLKEDLPILTDVFKGEIDRKVLYVALLLHDIGKGLPEDHSVAGARMAREICPRLGLSEQETETIEWLVANHLVMSDVAQKRDLSDPRTVRNFAKSVKTIARLKLLLALTVCDIRGVSNKAWNNWKAQLMRDLYRATLAQLKSGVDKVGTFNAVGEAKDALRAALTDWEPAAIEAELARHYDPYWQGLDTDTHVDFARMLSTIDKDGLVAEFTADLDRDATQACFAMQDHPGIFSRVAGALALAGANVVDARTYTSSDGYATAIFWIQDSDDQPYEDSRIKRLEATIVKTLKGEVIAKEGLQSRDKFKKRERDFRIPTQIMFDNEGSELYTIIEIATRDRPGLLFDLTRTLASKNIYIASAVIATYGAEVVDVFYVKDMFGMKIHSKDKQKLISGHLSDAIEAGTKGAMS